MLIPEASLESIDTPPTQEAIWNPNATANWSLLFSPAFGAYLQMLNWRALGEHDKAAASLKWNASRGQSPCWRGLA